MTSVLLNLALTILFVNDAPAPQFSAVQTENYKQNGCAKIYEEIFNKNLQEKINEKSTWQVSNYFFCGVKDLDPGAWNIARNISLCVELTDQTGVSVFGEVWFKTQGNLFCEGEALLTDQKVIVNIY